MTSYSGEITASGTEIHLVESTDALDTWLNDEDVSVLRDWLRESAPLTFSMRNDDGLVHITVNPEYTDTKDGKIYAMESMGTFQPTRVMEATHLELVIPAILFHYPSRDYPSQEVFVAITNEMTVPYNKVRKDIRTVDTARVIRLDRIDMEVNDVMVPHAVDGLFVTDNVSLCVKNTTLFIDSDQEHDTVIVIEQPQHTDYLPAIVYYLNSSFDDTLITSILKRGLPYTRIFEDAMTKYYVRVEDYFADNVPSMFE